MTTATAPEPRPTPAAPALSPTKPAAPLPVPQEYRFTAVDRCDSCRAQAYVGATVNGTELLFCAHHSRKYETKLRAVATQWHDETGRLYQDQTRVGISA